MSYFERFIMEFLDCSKIIRDGSNWKNVFDTYRKGDIIPLQDFIGEYIKNEHTWMSSLALIEAAEKAINTSNDDGIIEQFKFHTRWFVMGDHPTLKRPDRWIYDEKEKDNYVKELQDLGYENVEVKEEIT